MLRKRDDLRPGYFWISVPDFLGQARRCFADHGKLVKFGTGNELGDMLVEDVGEFIFLPHGATGSAPSKTACGEGRFRALIPSRNPRCETGISVDFGLATRLRSTDSWHSRLQTEPDAFWARSNMRR